MPEVLRLSDFQPRLHEHPEREAEVLCFPPSRVVRWPERYRGWPLVVPSLLPPFFAVLEVK